MPRTELKTLAFVLAGLAAFGAFLSVLGARLEPPTIAMLLTAAALALLLTSLYRMVVALARPATEVVLEHEGVLDTVAVRELRAEKRRVLRAINELQFDHEMGKLSDEDHRSVRELYELRAIEVMRLLDADQGLHPRVEQDLAKLEGREPEPPKQKAKAGKKAKAGRPEPEPAEAEPEPEAEPAAAEEAAPP